MHPPSSYAVKAWPSTTPRCCKVFKLQNHAFSLVCPLVSVIEGLCRLSPLLSFCIPIPCLMDPKQLFRKELGSQESSTQPDHKEKGILRWTHQATRAQLQAQEEVEHFKEHVPLEIHLEVEKVVGQI